jgi:hypothetical protein
VKTVVVTVVCGGLAHTVMSVVPVSWVVEVTVVVRVMVEGGLIEVVGVLVSSDVLPEEDRTLVVAMM